LKGKDLKIGRMEAGKDRSGEGWKRGRIEAGKDGSGEGIGRAEDWLS
jgi:hypothetical protein